MVICEFVGFACLCSTILYQESMADMVVMDVDKAECFVDLS